MTSERRGDQGHSSAASQCHIVVVDDPPDLENTCRLIQSLEYFATGVETGVEALRLVRGGDVHMVVTELFMPGIDGWDLARLIERERPQVHVLALASSISDQGEQVLTSRDIDGYLVKPVSKRPLEILLRALLCPTSLDRVATAMLVDTDADCLMRLEQALGDVGVATTSHDDPREALARAVENPPDILITELDLGSFDGLDLCEGIRGSKYTARLPILVLTDEASPENVARAIGLHVSGFLVKPMTPDTLTRRVLRRLQKRKA